MRSMAVVIVTPDTNTKDKISFNHQTKLLDEVLGSEKLTAVELRRYKLI